MSVELIKKVAAIQKALKAPKSQYNNFGKYSYRNQEDILEAVKPLLGDLILTVNDEMVEVGGRVYVKATSTITDGTNSVSNVAFAREPLEQKGMNEAQITGSTSSYARKYSLNGLLLIDDTKDADTDAVTAASKGVELKASNVKEAQVIAKETKQPVTVAVDPQTPVSGKDADVKPTVAKKGFAGVRANMTKKTETKEELF
jgi:ERF superfamily